MQTPETIDGRNWSPFSDIFTLALVFCEMLFSCELARIGSYDGRWPSPAELASLLHSRLARRFREQIDAISAGEVVYKTAFRECTDSLLALIEWMLSRYPQDRPTAEQVLAHPVWALYRALPPWGLTWNRVITHASSNSPAVTTTTSATTPQPLSEVTAGATNTLTHAISSSTIVATKLTEGSALSTSHQCVKPACGETGSVCGEESENQVPLTH